jgi:anti-anti-sigma factor
MVRSAHPGGAHDLTSEGPPTPEVETPIAPLADSIAGSADILPPAFVRSRTNVGLDAAWVHLAGALDVATAPQLERTLRDSQSRARLVVLDLRELAFMDRSGAHASISARQLGRRLILLRGPPNVDRVFTLTGSTGGGRERRPRPGLLRTSNGPTPLLSRRPPARARGSRGRRRDRSAQG